MLVLQCEYWGFSSASVCLTFSGESSRHNISYFSSQLINGTSQIMPFTNSANVLTIFSAMCLVYPNEVSKVWECWSWYHLFRQHPPCVWWNWHLIKQRRFGNEVSFHISYAWSLIEIGSASFAWAAPVCLSQIVDRFPDRQYAQSTWTGIVCGFAKHSCPVCLEGLSTCRWR